MPVISSLLWVMLATDPTPTPDAEAIARAQLAAKTLGESLKAKVTESMTAGGPVPTLDVCSTAAQPMTQAVAEQAGVRVGRASDRLRNPANVGPSWATAWLQEHAGQPAASLSPSATIAETPEGPVARVLVPIGIAEPCLKCHGATESLAPAVVEKLASLYPNDRATGYSLGDLRGVVWAEAPVLPSPSSKE